MIKNNRPTKITLVNFPQNIPFCSCLGSVWRFLKHFILMGHNSEKKVALVYFPKKPFCGKWEIWVSFSQNYAVIHNNSL